MKALVLVIILVLCGCAGKQTPQKTDNPLNTAKIQSALGNHQQKAIVLIDDKQITTSQTKISTPNQPESQLLNDALLQELTKAKKAGKTECLLAPSIDSTFGHFVSVFYTCGQADLAPNQLAFVGNANKVKMLPLRQIAKNHHAKDNEIKTLITITDKGYAINIGRTSVFVPPDTECPTDGPTICHGPEGLKSPHKLLKMLRSLQKNHPKANWQYLLTTSSAQQMKEVIDIAHQINSNLNATIGFAVPTNTFSRKEVYNKTTYPSNKIAEIKNFCDKNNIRTEFSAKATDIRKCIGKHSSASRPINGQWIVTWNINLDQTITGTSITKRPNKKHKAFEQCLLDVVQSMNFNRPNGGVCKVNYPLSIFQVKPKKIVVEKAL